MKRILLSLAIAVAAVGCGQKDAAHPEAPAAGAHHGDWMTDFPAAQAKAKAEGKLLLVDFTGSDWCPPCMKLSKEIFGSAEFAEYTKASLVLVELDFPQRKPQSEALKKANEALAQQFNVEGFPTVIVFDAAGKELMREVGYDGSSGREYVAKLSALKK